MISPNQINYLDSIVKKYKDNNSNDFFSSREIEFLSELYRDDDNDDDKSDLDDEELFNDWYYDYRTKIPPPSLSQSNSELPTFHPKLTREKGYYCDNFNT